MGTQHNFQLPARQADSVILTQCLDLSASHEMIRESHGTHAFTLDLFSTLFERMCSSLHSENAFEALS